MKNKTENSDLQVSSAKEDAKDSKNEEIQKKPVNSMNSNILSLNMPVIVSAVVAVGIVISIAGSYGVQKYRIKYVIPPQQEKTFLFPFNQKTDSSSSLRNVVNSHYILNFIHVSNPATNLITFSIEKNGTTILPNQLETIENGIPVVFNGGKLTFKYNQLIVGINYFFHANSSITVVIDSLGSAPNRSSDNLTVVISQGDDQILKIPLKSGSRKYFSFPSENGTAFSSEKDIDTQIKSIANSWLDGVNILVPKEFLERLPKAYLEIMEYAYAYVANSLNFIPSAKLIGQYENFTVDQTMFFIQSRNEGFTSFDDQVFPLMTLLKLNHIDTLNILNSWMSTINELGYMGNRFSEAGIVLEKIQSPLLFQLVKEALSTQPKIITKDNQFIEKLEYIAENTWKNSIGPGRLLDVKWMGHSRGIFQLEPATKTGESSFELFCLIGDMCRIMNKVYERVDEYDSKWQQRYLDFEAALPKYWNKELQQYGDLETGKFKPNSSSHALITLSLVNETSEDLTRFLQNIQTDNNFTPLGLQMSEDDGVSVSANYLLLRSLQFYALQSSPAQEMSLQMYSILKNNLAAAIARAYRPEKIFYGKFDRNMRPLGAKEALDGALIFAIMSTPM